MNTFLDLVYNWANKLTYKILKISGTDDATLQKLATAIEKKNEAELQADEQMRKEHSKFKLVKWLLIIAALYFGYKFLYKYFRKIKLF